MKMTSIPRLVLTLSAGAALAAALSACVPLVVGGAAVGAGLVATDRRTSGAQLDDQGIDNVRSVVNEVRVGEGRSFQVRSNDTFITGKVKASLLDAKDIFANSFKVITDDGTVYLMGLATRREVDRATDIVRGVSGVQKVVRVVEIVSEAELAGQLRPDTGAATPSSAPASSNSRVPLPPMAPLPAAPAGGATATPIR
ncbi:MAG: BON domain-containing protein [Comamonadaceae bacterium]|nr:MAG: BON domain-containing protein [Comamonadaceae bacterium]